MNPMLEYPFDPNIILQKKKSIKRELLTLNTTYLNKNIAVLGGSTTGEIKNILELFLLNYGIKPEFYESEYAQYWQDAMFGEELREFKPDVIFIHTTSRNITCFPTLRDSRKQINVMLEQQFSHFVAMWDKLAADYNCPIIQNNFERPGFRLLGNKDISDFHGRSNYVSRLNQMFYEYAGNHAGFYINDIDYLSASFGFEKWSDALYWHMYKYALCVSAIPELAFSVANIIKSIYGKNKKAFALDLDNTLWGGVVGDDGAQGIALGLEMPMGQAYSEFQEYIKAHKDLGVILNVCSKNDKENAIAGLNHPDSSLSPNDFVIIKANWENKDCNILEIANELNIGVDSLVFVDDNPVERAIVSAQIDGIAVPNIGDIEDYVSRIDRSGFFEATTMSNDDLKRGDMYKENINRSKLLQGFENYSDYLKSLVMVATIRDFEPIYTERIAQLTNKSNQFNLTTKRYSESEIIATSKDNGYIRLYGKLADKFGDNGIVSIIIGRKDNTVLHVVLWLMSCRVLKRDMEYAMFDSLVDQCKITGIDKIIGYYFPTAKNNMVREFYKTMGFAKVSEDDVGNTVWEYQVVGHEQKNHVIRINE